MTDTTDREMLEYAAKAAGYEVEMDHKGVFHIHEGTGPQSWRPWTPLVDDGDALRLAVKLGLDIEIEWYDDDPLAATRRAIVRVAAGIGKGMN